MRKGFKLIFTLSLAFIVAVGFSACSVTGAPEFTAQGEFYMGMWIGVPNTIGEYDGDGKLIAGTLRPVTDDEFLGFYQDIKGSGINVAYPGYGERSKAYNLRALTAAQAVGIKQLIEDTSIKDYLQDSYQKFLDGIREEQTIVNQLKSLAADYLSFDSLYGFMLKDEPSVYEYAYLSFAQEMTEKAFPGKIGYINLFPVIGGPHQFGNVTYEEYLSRYVEMFKSNYISYDHYPLFSDADGIGTRLEETFLYNMRLIQEVGGGLEKYTFLQSIKYGSRNRTLTSKADASFQAYSYLAYGGDGIQWFCYWSPPENDGATNFGEGMIGRVGNKTDIYDYVAATNKDVHYLYKYLSNFDWKGVMANDVYGGEGNFEYIDDVLITDKTLTSMKSSDDLFVGVFSPKAGEGSNAFLAVNFTDPGKNISNDVELSISGYSKALLVTNGESKAVRVGGGKLKFKLNSGESCFVIPFN